MGTIWAQNFFENKLSGTGIARGKSKYGMNVTADIVTNVETKRGVPGQNKKRGYASLHTTDCFPFAKPRWEDIRSLVKNRPGATFPGRF